MPDIWKKLWAADPVSLAGIDERMKYFEQRGSLKAGKIRKIAKRGYSEHQNADGC